MTSDLESQSKDDARERARKRNDDLQAFAIHLGVYLIVITGLFFIDVATGPGWWFFFPAIAWGIGLAIHGWVTATDAIFRDRETRPASRARVRHHKPETVSSPAANEQVIEHSTQLIDQMRSASRRIPNQDVRRQALALCGSADQVLSVIEETPGEQVLARDFLNRYLTPASSIISDYSRLANRKVASARPTLEKVETHDIPLLSAKIDELHDRLHRGSLIDLEVAREMLSLDLADWDDDLSTLQEISKSSSPSSRD